MKFQKLSLAILTMLTLQFFGNNSYAISPNVSISAASVENITAKDKLMVSQMRIFANLTVEQYGKLKGRNLNFFEKLSFKVSQHRIKLMLKAYDDGDGPTLLQKISWLLKGLLFGPLALILGYIFLKDDERELIKWIWFGFIGFAALVIAVLLTL